ncbi:hypothetical protein ACFSL4_32895 [Streptomyces caeni]|uniref:Uncharacterized protein n=1 Tax=Streptomyces caeni TaxID=2307231 RepID=A0ABW4IZZ7_9ACTN
MAQMGAALLVSVTSQIREPFRISRTWIVPGARRMALVTSSLTTTSV